MTFLHVQRGTNHAWVEIEDEAHLLRTMERLASVMPHDAEWSTSETNRTEEDA